MSLTKYNVEIDTEADKIEKPASRWRNRYIAIRHFTCLDSGKHYAPGELVIGASIWPSKDTAETWASSCKNGCVASGYAELLGAFPDGQDAP